MMSSKCQKRLFGNFLKNFMRKSKMTFCKGFDRCAFYEDKTLFLTSTFCVVNQQKIFFMQKISFNTY